MGDDDGDGTGQGKRTMMGYSTPKTVHSRESGVEGATEEMVEV
jgi:hypothetical protein